MAKPSGRPIREELLASASTLIQRVGVNACSYGALADELGISSPSIHHHFRTKDDLIGAVAARYRVDFAAHVAAIGSGDPVEDIVAFADLFDATAKREAMCLCGSVASDWMTVGELARTEVRGFFADQVAWLSVRLGEGTARGSIDVDGELEETARMLLAILQGAMLLARAGDDDASPSAMVRHLLSGIRT
jgi:TetR/AcrR family transcriptional repressor of nem operon